MTTRSAFCERTSFATASSSGWSQTALPSTSSPRSRSAATSCCTSRLARRRRAYAAARRSRSCPCSCRASARAPRRAMRGSSFGLRAGHGALNRGLGRISAAHENEYLSEHGLILRPQRSPAIRITTYAASPCAPTSRRGLPQTPAAKNDPRLAGRLRTCTERRRGMLLPRVAFNSRRVRPMKTIHTILREDSGRLTKTSCGPSCSRSAESRRYRSNPSATAFRSNTIPRSSTTRRSC